MARRVPWRTQHGYRTVTEYILVQGLRLDLVLALDPTLERLEVHALGGLRAGDRFPFLSANQQGCFREGVDLASMVGMIVADSDIFDLIGLNVDLGQLIDHAHLWCNIGRRHGMTGIPQHILVTMLDEVATEDELNLQAREGKGVREALIDDRWCLWRAAIEAGQRYIRGLRRWRQSGEQAGTE